MAAAQKFNAFVANLANGVHNLGAHALKVMLTNTAPLSTNSVKADLVEIAAGNGYTAGGALVTITSSAQMGGTYALVGNDVTITATGGPIGPFRYAVLYNDTPTLPADPLIQFWDYGASITLAAGEPLLVDFGPSILTNA